MSANNAIYLIQIEWTFPNIIQGGQVTDWRTEPVYFVCHADVDMMGEQTSSGVVTKELLWSFLNNGVVKCDTLGEATLVATTLEKAIEIVEYGVITLPTITYKED